MSTSHAHCAPPRAPETLAGWGRLPQPGRERRGEDLRALSQDVALSRGLGRSYGDSSLPPADKPEALNTTLADRILAFDTQTGRLRAEAGLTLLTMNEVLLPRGWFTPVSPGTQFVTVGGMIAADVHGKNHHVDGCFGEHVRWMKMRVASGDIVECTRQQHGDLFRATIGGMGLTGHILEAEFTLKRIPSPWIWQQTERVDNIDAFEQALADAAAKWPYTVGWIDCVSR
ncbi:MAG: FAD-binding protein, partial [Polyangiales bacterium]